MAYAVYTGGTWTFACSATITFKGPLDVPSGHTVALQSSQHTVTLSGGTATRLFTVAVAGSLTLDGLTVANGRAPGGSAKPAATAAPCTTTAH